MNILTTLFFDPFLNILMILTKVLGGNMALGIIALTVLFRLAVLPLNLKMLHSQRRMQQLKPKLDKLKEQHGTDRMALSQAQMELYKAEGVSPTGGCLPLLLQLPFLFGIYAVFRFAVGLTDVSQLNSHLYFSWLQFGSLSDISLQLGWLNIAKPDPYYILPALAALSQFAVSKLMMLPKSALPKPDGKKQASLEDSLMAAQGQMIYFFPIMTFLVTWKFPAGLALYWTVGNLFSIIQQIYINRSVPVVQLQTEINEIEQEAAAAPGISKSVKKPMKKSTKRKKS